MNSSLDLVQVRQNILEWQKLGYKKIELRQKVSWSNTWVYVIGEADSMMTKGFKVGFHTGSRKDLRERYITPLPNHEIHLFAPATAADELRLKQEFSTFRLANNEENLSEWVLLPLAQILFKISLALIETKVQPKVEVEYLEMKTAADVRIYIERSLFGLVENPIFTSLEPLSGNFTLNKVQYTFSSETEFHEKLTGFYGVAAPNITELLLTARAELCSDAEIWVKRVVQFDTGQKGYLLNIPKWTVSETERKPLFVQYNVFQSIDHKRLEIIKDFFVNVFPEEYRFRDLVRWHLSYNRKASEAKNLPIPEFIKKGQKNWTIQSQGNLRILFNCFSMTFNQGLKPDQEAGVTVVFSNTYKDPDNIIYTGTNKGPAGLRLFFQKAEPKSGDKAKNIRIPVSLIMENSLTLEMFPEFVYYFINSAA